jgi:hypothetical protein
MFLCFVESMDSRANENEPSSSACRLSTRTARRIPVSNSRLFASVPLLFILCFFSSSVSFLHSTHFFTSTATRQLPSESVFVVRRTREKKKKKSLYIYISVYGLTLSGVSRRTGRREENDEKSNAWRRAYRFLLLRVTVYLFTCVSICRSAHFCLTHQWWMKASFLHPFYVENWSMWIQVSLRNASHIEIIISNVSFISFVILTCNSNMCSSM